MMGLPLPAFSWLHVIVVLPVDVVVVLPVDVLPGGWNAQVTIWRSFPGTAPHWWLPPCSCWD